VGAADRFNLPGCLRVPSFDAPPKLVGRYIEVVQFDADSEAASCGSHVVSFDPRPEPKIEHDAQSEAQNLLGEVPEFAFDLVLDRCVPRASAQCPHPFILGET